MGRRIKCIFQDVKQSNILFCHPVQLQGFAQNSLFIHYTSLITTKEWHLPTNNLCCVVNGKYIFRALNTSKGQWLLKMDASNGKTLHYSIDIDAERWTLSPNKLKSFCLQYKRHNTMLDSQDCHKSSKSSNLPHCLFFYHLPAQSSEQKHPVFSLAGWIKNGELALGMAAKRRADSCSETKKNTKSYFREFFFFFPLQ